MTRKIILATLLGVLLVVIFAFHGQYVSAQDTTRQTTIVVSFTEYEWWLIEWQDNEILCRIVVDHAGLPTAEEVLKSCGQVYYEAWLNTPPCKQAANVGQDVARCEGLYLHLVSTRPAQRDVVIELPPATVWINLEGCTPKPPENICATIPSLVFTGDEPLPNEHITAIHGIYDGQPFTCPGSVCRLPLKSTPVSGATIEFWADSSYGDSSEHFTARVRVIDTGVSNTPGGGGWFVDVISSQWTGPSLASCMRIWGAFPPVGAPPTWLSTPERSELLASGAPYFYLAGRLISQGVVDAEACSTGGLLPNGYADACGLEAAKPILIPWQNQFDQRMITVAKETGIPAQLMKNLFAQESQFWPGMFRVPYEFGLGQITDQGADSILLWNESFYEQFCPLVLAEDACAKGYLHLKSDEQALLRGAVATSADSTCPTCATGIDLSNADFSINLFAQTLQANCAQIGQTIVTATELSPGAVASYEDLWRFAVANYHAGPGCTSFAIYQAWQSAGKLTWETVSQRFTEACKGVVPYVEKVTGK
jgi:hypothetical protein